MGKLSTFTRFKPGTCAYATNSGAAGSTFPSGMRARLLFL